MSEACDELLFILCTHTSLLALQVHSKVFVILYPLHSHKPAGLTGLTMCSKAKFALIPSIASLTGYEPCALTSFSSFNTLVGPGEAVRRIRNGLGLQLCHPSLCLDSCSLYSFQTRHSGCPSAPFVQSSRLGFFGIV